MKKLLLFVVVGLSLGLGVGSYLGGSRERDVILERMAAEKAAAEAQEETSTSQVKGSEDRVSEAAGEDSPDASDGVQEEDGMGEHPDGPGPDEAGLEESREGEASEGGDDDAEEFPDAQSQASALASAASLAAPEVLPPEGPARLAKIFGAMEAREAAAILQNLKDGEVQAILIHMSNRKVAEILGEFEPERAAALSRIVLDSRTGATR